MGGEFSTFVRSEQCIQKFSRKKWVEKVTGKTQA